MNGTNIWDMNHSTFQFAVPYIHRHLKEQYLKFHLIDSLRLRYSSDKIEAYEKFRRSTEELDDIISALSLYCQHCKFLDTSSADKLNRFLDDAKVLQTRQHRVLRFDDDVEQKIQRVKQGDVLEEQLQEARASRAVALSVSRLTKLAFIYIPMNFVCAMLGMNLAVFGQGTIPPMGFSYARRLHYSFNYPSNKLSHQQEDITLLLPPLACHQARHSFTTCRLVLSAVLQEIRT